MKEKSFNTRNIEALNTRTAKVGGYSFIISVAFLALLVLVNVAVSLLPSTLTQYDISAAQLYSVTSATRAAVQNISKDTTIYWICQNGEEDQYLEPLLNVYGGLSDRLTVIKKNPDVSPTFVSQYTDSDAENNSIIVECGEKYRYISYNDIYSIDMSSYYTTGSYSAYFQGESEITSAISYVNSEVNPIIYALTGHGEESLDDSTIGTSITHANYDLQELALVSCEEVPEDAEAIIVYAPTSDISDTELEMLEAYVEDGGQLFITSGPNADSELVNFHKLLEDYGIAITEGVIFEEDSASYAFGYAYMLLPAMNADATTTEMIDAGSYVILPVALGITVPDSENEEITYSSKLSEVVSLLDSSETAYLKPYNSSSMDRDDTSVDGPFSVGAKLSFEGGGSIVWIGSDDFLSDQINSYSSGANVDLAMNVLAEMAGETDSISIRAKSLNYNYLTISDANAQMIKIILIGILPLLYLLMGIFEVVNRRKLA